MTHTTTTQQAFYVAYVLDDRAGLAHRSTTLKGAQAKLAKLATRPGTRCIVAISGTYRPDKVSTTRPDQVAMFVARNDVSVKGGAPMPAFLALAMAKGAPSPATVPAATVPAPAPIVDEVDADEVDDLPDDLFDDLTMADEVDAWMGSDEAAMMADLDYRSALAGIDF